jgi:hypothetical protein
MVTLNDGELCRLTLAHWLDQGWIVVAPHSPLVAMAGPGLAPDLTLRTFCGEAAPVEPQPIEPPQAEPFAGETEPFAPNNTGKESGQ